LVIPKTIRTHKFPFLSKYQVIYIKTGVTCYHNLRNDIIYFGIHIKTMYKTPTYVLIFIKIHKQMNYVINYEYP